jgi:hypothetical protein
LAALYSQEQQRHAAPYLIVIQRGKQRGEVSPKTDGPAMVAQLVGPLFYRRWFSREPLDKNFVRSVLRSVLAKAQTA